MLGSVADLADNDGINDAVVAEQLPKRKQWKNKMISLLERRVQQREWVQKSC